MIHRLEGRCAVITGGASGIGEATVRRFVDEGASVVVADVDEDRGRALADELGDVALFTRTDVTIEEEIAAAVDLAVSRFGRLDVMFNNAGIIGAVGPISSLDADHFDRTVAILFRGVALGMKHAARVMVPQGHGAIVSTASVGAVAGGMGAHVYSASKAAVIGLSRSVSAELWPHGIRVNAVVPGKISTPLVANLRSARGADPVVDSGTDRVAERVGVPEDIAAAVAFLASDDASFVNGEELFVDAGIARSGWTAMVGGTFSEGSMLDV